MNRMFGLLMMVGLVVGVGCGSDDDNPLSAEQSLFVGCWSGYEGTSSEFWLALNTDGTVTSNLGPAGYELQSLKWVFVAGGGWDGGDGVELRETVDQKSYRLILVSGSDSGSPYIHGRASGGWTTTVTYEKNDDGSICGL